MSRIIKASEFGLGLEEFPIQILPPEPAPEPAEPEPAEVRPAEFPEEKPAKAESAEKQPADAEPTGDAESEKDGKPAGDAESPKDGKSAEDAESEKDAKPAGPAPAVTELPPPPPPKRQIPIQSLEAAVKERYRAILEEAFRKARQIVESAQNYRTAQLREVAEQVEKERQEAARERERAREEAAKEREKAKEQGYEEGLSLGTKEGEQKGMEAGLRQGSDEGLRKAAAENRKYVSELAQMIELVEQSKSKILSDFETDLKDLAMTIAEAVVKKELETDPKTLHSIILNAMDSYRNQAWVRIYVSEGTANLLLKADAQIAEELKNVSDNVKVIVTSGMDDGACVLETPDRVIDAGTGTQLRKIKSALDDAIRSDSL